MQVCTIYLSAVKLIQVLFLAYHLTLNSLKLTRKNLNLILIIMRAIKTKWNLKRQCKSWKYQRMIMQLNFLTLRNSNICHQDFILTECQSQLLIKVIPTTNWVFAIHVKFFDLLDRFTVVPVVSALKCMTITVHGLGHVSV